MKLIKIFFQSILIAIRPKTLVASVAPVLMTASFALKNNCFSWTLFCKSFGVLLGLQIGTNLVNDYYDYMRGADNDDRLGPTRVTQKGLIAHKILFLMILLCFGLSLFLSWNWGKWIFGFVCLATCMGVFYTAGPCPCAYNGWGDIIAFLFFGPIAVVGLFYLYSFRWNWTAMVLGLGCGFFSVALMTVNNLRDRHGDAKVNKKTLVVRFGALFARIEYSLSLLLAYGVLLFFFLQEGNIFFLFALFSLSILSLSPLQSVWNVSMHPSFLNKTLADTGKLYLIYSVLLSVGILL